MAKKYAPISVEPAIFVDSRFQNFMMSVGNRREAMGTLLDLWFTAQRYWFDLKNPKQLIPFDVWDRMKFPESLIECGLAERRELGIYARGSEEQFQWRFDHIEKCRQAGLKSADSRRNKYGTAQPKTPNVPEPVFERSRTSPNDAEPSSSSSSSSEEAEEQKYIYTNSIETHEVKQLDASKEKKSSNEIQEVLPECIEIWGKTLNQCGIHKPPKMDEVAIARLLSTHGYEKTKLALLGAAYEAAGPGFDPKKHVVIDRLYKPAIFEKFVNLGARAIHDGEEGPQTSKFKLTFDSTYETPPRGA